MKKEAYIQASTRVRMAEKELLTKAQMTRLAEAQSIDELNRILQETDWQSDIANLDKPEEYEKMLDAQLKRLYDFMYEISPDPRLVDFFAARYSYHNMKVLAKELLQNEDFEHIYIALGDVPNAALKSAEEAGHLNREGHYGEVLGKVLEDFREKREPGRIDMLMDRAYAEQIHRIAKETEIPMLEEYVADTVDLLNLLMLFRAKKMDAPLEFFREAALPGGNLYLPTLEAKYFDTVDSIASSVYAARIGDAVRDGMAAYEASGRLSFFEQAMENRQMQMAQRTKLVSYGPEVLISYLISKETEIKNLRILYVSKRNKLKSEQTRERLRLTYV